MSESKSKQTVFVRATETAAKLRSSLPSELAHPKLAIVCGSGLGGLADTIHAEPRKEIPYSDVPGFAVSTGMLHKSGVDNNQDGHH
jgi:purine-nucleoside phosphorylase